MFSSKNLIRDEIEVIQLAKAEYALYKGDKFIDIGTADELAKKRNVSKRMIYYLSTPTYKRKLKKRKKNKNALFVEKIDG